MEQMQAGIDWIVANWDKIPENFKTDIRDRYGSISPNASLLEGLPEAEHQIILLLDRQKPSVLQSYDFDEERIGVSKTGKVIWGFDSGCSCPTPWEDGAKCYTCTDTWKQFSVDLSSFDEGAIDECLARIAEIQAATS